MWSIKEVKTRAQRILKTNYWTLVFLCSVLLFLGILPGNGMQFASMTSTVITGQEEDVETEKEYKPGLIRYLESILDGENKERQIAIAEEVLESSKGRGGSVYGIARAIDRFFFANDTAAKILIVVALAVFLFYWFFVANLLYIGFCRICMDAGKPGYEMAFSDLFVMFRTSGYLNATWVSTVWELSIGAVLAIAYGLGVWGTTVIANQGSFVLAGILLFAAALAGVCTICVYLATSMIPYILATNPKASVKECFELSKTMMDGSKWQVVKLRLSYLGWDLLSLVTFGLVGLFYITPVTYMAYGQVYLELRAKALRENQPYSYLLEGDTLKLIPKALQPNAFGKLIEDNNPIRTYSTVNIVLMFFIFAFGGWCWEVLLHIVKDGVFVNRGMLQGPWLPIYGFGGAGICYFLNKYAKKPSMIISLIFVGCGVLEYFTHWYLEYTKGTKWWDYSNYFLNINGRVCFEGLFVFCVAGLFAVYVAGPALDNLLNRISEKKKWTIAGILVALLALDVVYSHSHPNVGKGITDYNR